MKLILPLLKLNVQTKNKRIYSNLLVANIINGNKVYGELDSQPSNKVNVQRTFGMAILSHDKEKDMINANVQFYDDKISANIFDKLTTGEYVLQPKISVREEDITSDNDNNLIKKYSIISFSAIPKHLSSQFNDN